MCFFFFIPRAQWAPISSYAYQFLTSHMVQVSCKYMQIYFLSRNMLTLLRFTRQLWRDNHQTAAATAPLHNWPNSRLTPAEPRSVRRVQPCTCSHLKTPIYDQSMIFFLEADRGTYPHHGSFSAKVVSCCIYHDFIYGIPVRAPLGHSGLQLQHCH